MKDQEIPLSLMKKMGIKSHQLEKTTSCGKPMPEFWEGEIDHARKHILAILPLDLSHWQIPIETIQTVFDEYEIVGSWRETRRQLGNCSYYKKRIRINLGYIYHRSEKARKQKMYNTLVHEYVHAILYHHYNENQGHNHRFLFYLRLLTGKTYRQGR